MSGEEQAVTTVSSEAALLQSVARGDDAAVATFYRQYANGVFRFVLRRVDGQCEDAEEIVQETFLSALSLAPTYKGDAAPLTWLCGIAKLRIVDFYRRQTREKRVPPDKVVAMDDDSIRALRDLDAGAASVEDIVDRVDAERLVHSMMAALSDDEREALMLRYVEEFSMRDIARLLNRTEKAAEHLIVRAKRKAADAATEWV